MLWLVCARWPLSLGLGFLRLWRLAARGRRATRRWARRQTRPARRLVRRAAAGAVLGTGRLGWRITRWRVRTLRRRWARRLRLLWLVSLLLLCGRRRRVSVRWGRSCRWCIVGGCYTLHDLRRHRGRRHACQRRRSSCSSEHGCRRRVHVRRRWPWRWRVRRLGRPRRKG